MIFPRTYGTSKTAYLKYFGILNKIALKFSKSEIGLKINNFYLIFPSKFYAVKYIFFYINQGESSNKEEIVFLVV